VGVLYDGRLVAEGSPGGLIGRTAEEGGDADLEDAFLELTSEQATT
jgi:ABC-2 type transport system ATP-binding protein